MTHAIFVNKYDRIKEKIDGCLPEGSEVSRLDCKCVLITLPREEKRKEVIAACREQLAEKERVLVQSVINCKEGVDYIEVVLPELMRFFPKS